MEEELYTGSSMGMKNLAKIIEGYGEIKPSDMSAYIEQLNHIEEILPQLKDLPKKHQRIDDTPNE